MVKLKTKGEAMKRVIRAKVLKGMLKPLGKLDLEEGKEITITVEEVSPKKEGFERAAGSWKGTLDFEEFLKDLYARRHSYRKTEVRL